MNAAYVAIAALIAITSVLGWHLWGKAAARAAAEEWLIQHRYHLREIRPPSFRPGVFLSSLFGNEKSAFDFEAVVDDRDLGGTSTVLVRVWADRIGRLTGEIETVADSIARSDATQTQITILQRVAAGETGFYAPRNSEAEDAEFNQLVEHIIALSRRGMVKCDAPTVDVRDSGQYVAIDKIMLTPAGRSWLESRQ